MSPETTAAIPDGAGSGDDHWECRADLVSELRRSAWPRNTLLVDVIETPDWFSEVEEQSRVIGCDDRLRGSRLSPQLVSSQFAQILCVAGARSRGGQHRVISAVSVSAVPVAVLESIAMDLAIDVPPAIIGESLEFF